MKKIIKYRYILFFSILITVVSCLKTDDCPDSCFTPPAPFTLKIVDTEGNNLVNNITYIPDSINIYYIKENSSNDVKVYFDEVSDGYIINSPGLPWEMMETNDPVFFLYLNNSDTDTLTIVVVQKSDGCCTWHSYDTYQYNGENMVIDPDVYAFVGVK